jgi:hypothetical protein
MKCVKCDYWTLSKSGFCLICNSKLWLSPEQIEGLLVELRVFLDSKQSLVRIFGMKRLGQDLKFWNIDNKKSLSTADLKVLRHKILIERK